ncbi:MAG TPA: outer membrane protein transport protein, partial [Pararhizobium sp.]|nr:outer membrane protein transport protein [Pararhizobium sp.]
DPATGQAYATSADESESYWVPYASMKFDLTDDLACAAQYRQPWGAYTDVGVDTAIALSSIEQKISSTDIGVNCSYRFDMGRGNLRLLGGLSYQYLHGEQTQLLLQGTVPSKFGIPSVFEAPAEYNGLARIGALDVDGAAAAWRVGLAYEVPEIALRAQLVYQSETDYDLTGTIANLFSTPIDVRSSATLPQSVEFKLQSGIAKGWLAFGSVKWTDWSIENAIPFASSRSYFGGLIEPGREITRLNLYYRDGWKVSGGIGHKFTDALSMASFVTWDRGVSTGLSSQTDTWMLGLTGAYKPTPVFEVHLTGVLGLMTSGVKDDTVVAGEPNPKGTIADFGNDLVSALSVSAKLKF